MSGGKVMTEQDLKEYVQHVYELEKNILVAVVVVFQIIGMLPDIKIQNWIEQHGKRAVLIGKCKDLQISKCIADKPCISGAKN